MNKAPQAADDRPRGRGTRGSAHETADGAGEPREARRRSWALTVMGFSRGGFTAESLRARYRELMMRHHPDADPTGLERCKDVNVAYSLLIADAGALPFPGPA